MSFPCCKCNISLPKIQRVMLQNKTLQLKLERRWPTENYTIGRFYVNGEFWCNTLEPKVRDLTKEKKVPGKTAIPAGTYEVIITYSQKFKRRLPILLNVPDFTGVRIHSGNKVEDTEACILPGENKKKGMVLNSKFWEGKITNLIESNGGKALINII